MLPFFFFPLCRGGPLADEDGLDAVLAGNRAGGRGGKRAKMLGYGLGVCGLIEWPCLACSLKTYPSWTCGMRDSASMKKYGESGQGTGVLNPIAISMERQEVGGGGEERDEPVCARIAQNILGIEK